MDDVGREGDTGNINQENVVLVHLVQKVAVEEEGQHLVHDDSLSDVDADAGIFLLLRT